MLEVDISGPSRCAITETFTNISTVKAFTLERYFRSKYAEATEQALKTGFRRSGWSGLFFGLSDSTIVFVTGGLPSYVCLKSCPSAWYNANTHGVYSTHILLRRDPYLVSSLLNPRHPSRLQHATLQHWECQFHCRF